MPLSPGTRLGPYEIVAPLGAGGMGEVFKARDTRLDRSVAIKILPAEFAQNAQLRVRFEREARTISQLTHPHICTLHDVGSENGISYLVMELLEGESLADRLARGPLPLADVLRYGAQIADALAKAHRHGVVHRDLKPGNIMITRGGAKLLDFGLAKTAAVIAHDEATVARGQPLTAEGTILGTFQYMAPEQLEGIEADARTDIFALGAVLYEMATGRRAFDGKTKTSLIAAIVAGEPRPMRESQPLTPPAFEHLVQRCLRKDPDERWQSAHDVADELRWIAEASQSVQAQPRGVSPKLSSIVAALFALAAIGFGAWVATRPAPPRRIVRTILAAPPGERISDITPVLSISPDGSRIVFQSLTSAESVALRVRSLDRFDAVPLRGGDGGRSPAFSPDGQWIAFIGGAKLQKVAAAGGAPAVLADAPNARGIAWSSDGATIYYSPRPNSGIWRVGADGTDARPLTTPDPKRHENSHRWPQALPDGRHVLMTIRTPDIASFDDAKIAVLSLERGTWETVLEGASFARYVPTGHLLFARGGALHAIPFDLETLRTRGGAQVVVERLEANGETGVAHFDVAGDGSLVYVSGAGGTRGVTHLVSIGTDGVRPLSRATRPLFAPSISPDGRFIAGRMATANDDIWIYDIARDAFTRLSFEPGDEQRPVWTADGKQVIYGSFTDNQFRVVIKPADGSGESRVLLRAPTQLTPWSVSPDGKWLALMTATPATRRDISLLSLVDGSLQKLVATPFIESDPQFSPDGKWIAYLSNETGELEIYARSARQGGGRWQVSTTGGVEPRWSPDGREIYFRKEEQLFRASVTETNGALTIGTPRPYLRIERLADTYNVAPDGRIISAVYPATRLGATGIHYVANWTEELKRRVPHR